MDISLTCNSIGSGKKKIGVIVADYILNIYVNIDMEDCRNRNVIIYNHHED